MWRCYRRLLSIQWADLFPVSRPWLRDYFGGGKVEVSSCCRGLQRERSDPICGAVWAAGGGRMPAAHAAAAVGMVAPRAPALLHHLSHSQRWQSSTEPAVSSQFIRTEMSQQIHLRRRPPPLIIRLVHCEVGGEREESEPRMDVEQEVAGKTHKGGEAVGVIGVKLRPVGHIWLTKQYKISARAVLLVLYSEYR